MTIREKTVYTFKKNQVLDFDDIYMIQGLGTGDWWQKSDGDMGEKIIITQDIEITIRIKTPNPSMQATGNSGVEKSKA